MVAAQSGLCERLNCAIFEQHYQEILNEIANPHETIGGRRAMALDAFISLDATNHGDPSSGTHHRFVIQI
jgi:hypothetical protein